MRACGYIDKMHILIALAYECLWMLLLLHCRICFFLPISTRRFHSLIPCSVSHTYRLTAVSSLCLFSCVFSLSSNRLRDRRYKKHCTLRGCHGAVNCFENPFKTAMYKLHSVLAMLTTFRFPSHPDYNLDAWILVCNSSKNWIAEKPKQNAVIHVVTTNPQLKYHSRRARPAEREWENGSVWKYTNVGDNGGGVGGNDDDDRKYRLMFKFYQIESNRIESNVYKLERTHEEKIEIKLRFSVFFLLWHMGISKSIFEYYVIVFYSFLNRFELFIL